MKKKLFVFVSILTLPIIGMLAFSHSCFNLSSLVAQNVEALTSEKKNVLKGYALLWHSESQTQRECHLDGSIDITPYFSIMNSSLEADYTYNIVFAGYICQPVENNPDAECDTGKQSVTSFSFSLFSSKKKQKS